jgi:L-ascorbate metabolism protein UlaG (beta-lactamase superfamily)
MALNYEGLKIEWLGHACFKVSNSKRIYFDPFKLSVSEKADIILITHEHFDHCSPEDIEKIVKSDTIIFASRQCRALAGKGWKVVYMRPGEKERVEGITVEAVPAYNTNKHFHPKEDEKLGYVVTFEGKRIYHAGDTDLIPEMSSLKAIDIALLPVGGTYTMNAEEASEAVSIIKPKVAIPAHYGTIVGSRKDAEKFKLLVKSAEVYFG